jgi:hypothetical protein
MSFIIGVKLVCNVNTTHIIIVVIINAGISVRTTHSPSFQKIYLRASLTLELLRRGLSRVNRASKNPLQRTFNIHLINNNFDTKL